LKITTFLIALGTVSVMVHALSSSVAQFSLLSLSFFSTEVAVLSVSHAVIVFYPEFNIRLYDKTSESDYSFFLHQNQNIFLSNIGNQNIFLEKNILKIS
jgi:hypothetical protein